MGRTREPIPGADAMTKPVTVGSALEALALEIATKASAEGVALDKKVDAFKALTSYHVAMMKPAPKGKKDDPEEDEDGTPNVTFADFQNNIKRANQKD